MAMLVACLGQTRHVDASKPESVMLDQFEEPVNTAYIYTEMYVRYIYIYVYMCCIYVYMRGEARLYMYMRINKSICIYIYVSSFLLTTTYHGEIESLHVLTATWYGLDRLALPMPRALET